ncbi:MAG: response regulator [Verrucomicrobiales bacterium]|nr:response regulator [Verrucomicrobiales bacterium]
MSKQLSGKSILLADDEDNDALLIKRAFKKAEITTSIHRVKDGEDALSYLEGEGVFRDRVMYPFPDMVLLDLKMPRRSGFEVLRWIRAHEHFKRMVVIVLTSSQQSFDINQAYDLGANSYLVKPLNFEELMHLSILLNKFWLQFCQHPEIHSPREAEASP